MPPDHAAGAKLRCLRLLRAIRCAISPANRSMGNDRFPANVQKTTFSCDRQHIFLCPSFSNQMKTVAQNIPLR